MRFVRISAADAECRRMVLQQVSAAVAVHAAAAAALVGGKGAEMAATGRLAPVKQDGQIIADCREPNGCADCCAARASDPLSRVNRMPRRSAPPRRPTAPILTLDQKRYRIERFRVCIQRLEDFDPEKVQRRVGVPEVVTLEAGIDNALSATFGYGTRSYFRFHLVARLDVGPLVTSTPLEGTVLRSVAGPEGLDELAAQEAQRYFSEGKARSIALLREAICTLEAEVSNTRAAVGAAQQSEATQTAAQRNALRQRVRGAFAPRQHGAVWGDGGGGAVNESLRPRSHGGWPGPAGVAHQ
jgi:hypothetical protein